MRRRRTDVRESDKERVMMHTVATAPRPRDISSTCQAIRAHWTRAKRRARQELAQVKQRQLVRSLRGVATDHRTAS